MMMDSAEVRHYTVGVLVANEPGVLSRVSGLFSRRGFNIESLAVGPTQDRTISRITLVVNGDEAHIEQLVQQLYKLISVQKVQVFSKDSAVERQLVMVKVAANAEQRESIMRLADVFRAKILDVSRSTMILQITGDAEKVSALLELLSDYGVLEMAQTGAIALERGESFMNSELFD